jgi:RNA-directed DNA polymerase
MTLSDEKTHITHLDDGFVFLGFHIQRRSWGDGRRVVLTIASKQALASVMHKIKKLTGRSTTSLSLEEVLRTRSLGAGLPTSATALRRGRSPTSAGMRGGG